MPLHIVRPHNLVHIPGRVLPEPLHGDVPVAGLPSGPGAGVGCPDEELEVQVRLYGGHGGRVEQEAVQDAQTEGLVLEGVRGGENLADFGAEGGNEGVWDGACADGVLVFF